MATSSVTELKDALKVTQGAEREPRLLGNRLPCTLLICKGPWPLVHQPAAMQDAMERSGGLRKLQAYARAEAYRALSAAEVSCPISTCTISKNPILVGSQSYCRGAVCHWKTDFCTCLTNNRG